jgi:hypothetical protein
MIDNSLKTLKNNELQTNRRRVEITIGKPIKLDRLRSRKGNNKDLPQRVEVVLIPIGQNRIQGDWNHEPFSSEDRDKYRIPKSYKVTDASDTLYAAYLPEEYEAAYRNNPTFKRKMDFYIKKAIPSDSIF